MNNKPLMIAYANGTWDKGEDFVDLNNNQIWDNAEEFVDIGNGLRDDSENFEDLNNNSLWDFEDRNGNEICDIYICDFYCWIF